MKRRGGALALGVPALQFVNDPAAVQSEINLTVGLYLRF